MTRNSKRLVTVIAATLIAVGAAGCHVGVSVHSNPGGVKITSSPSPSHHP
jgi:hypothetical protein